MDDYRTAVCDHLGLPLLREGAGGLGLQVVFMPSFHPEVALTLEAGAAECAIELRTCGTNVFHYQQYRAEADRGHVAPGVAPAAPRLVVKRGRVGDELAASLRERVAAIRLSVWDGGGVVVDGMRALCMVRDDSGRLQQAEIAACDGAAAADALELLNHLFDATAASLLPDAAVRLALEGLHGYLGRGLPAAIVGTEPVTARVFGGLSVHDDAALAAFLQQLPVDEPVLMDLSNFGFMAALLFPRLREFLAGRTAPVAWLVNDAARQQLAAVGVPETAMADTFAAALALLR